MVTTICGRLGLGIGFNLGWEGNAGFDPNGNYGKDCDGDKKDCSLDWSIGIGIDSHYGPLGGGGSVAYGSTGLSIIGDIPFFEGIGYDWGGGIEACLIITCPY